MKDFGEFLKRRFSRHNENGHRPKHGERMENNIALKPRLDTPKQITNIHIQILQTDLYTFLLRMSWDNLIKDQGIFSLVIILLVLIT